MDALSRAGFLAHANSKAFARKLSRSIEVCEQFAQQCAVPIGSISFGKDSVVVADLLRRLRPDLPFLHGDRGAGGDTQEVADLKALLIADWGLNVTTVKTRYSALECYQQEQPIRQYLIEALAAGEQQLGADGNALGITRDESRARRLSVAKHGLLFDMRSGIKRCYPIGHWSALDVWAYTVSRELPYLPIYDRLAEQGTDYLNPMSRTSNIVGGSALTWGRLQASAEASEEMRQFYAQHGIDF